MKLSLWKRFKQMVAHSNLSLPIGYTRTKTYEDRGTPDKIGEIWEFTGSSDATKDGLWITTGTSSNADWARITDLVVPSDSITSSMIESQLLKDIAGLTLSEGDLLYYTSGSIVNLGVGTAGQVLKVSAGVPSWQDEAGGAGAGNLTLKCWLNGLTSLPNVTSSDITEWTTEAYDPDNLHNNVTNPSRITVAENGEYLLEYQLAAYQSGVNPSWLTVSALINNDTLFAINAGTFYVDEATQIRTFTGQAYLTGLTATDYIELRVAEYGGDGITFGSENNQSWLKLVKVG